MGDVSVLFHVELDEEGYPALPRWAAQAAGLRDDQRTLAVLSDGQVVLAHLITEASPTQTRRPDPPQRPA